MEAAAMGPTMGPAPGNGSKVVPQKHRGVGGNVVHSVKIKLRRGLFRIIKPVQTLLETTVNK